ncbi:hypothetical protein N5D48_15345 [Pseudomonas sp. GD03858]|uniref:hypothetical protein n=1 Tax=unclassified Pseudomonas TaxID=196821 RepID=UPI0024499E9A|nr:MULTISPECIES: hypothetical protein [unclassified Pseudomonas]MDH0646883.1 hypothetical protein [Pseudomonas sp. GD03867]MDH0663785.1 hypothetical protein [Pseudomonas sp. GD03858]
MSSRDLSLHQGTPAVTVRSNRGLGVREIAFHRHPDTPQLVDQRITRHQYDARGHHASSIDPRLHEHLQRTGSGAANFTFHASMGGDVLRTDSVDAGRTFGLKDIEGRELLGSAPMASAGAAGTRQLRWPGACCGSPSRSMGNRRLSANGSYGQAMTRHPGTVTRLACR